MKLVYYGATTIFMNGAASGLGSQIFSFPFQYFVTHLDPPGEHRYYARPFVFLSIVSPIPLLPSSPLLPPSCFPFELLVY